MEMWAEEYWAQRSSAPVSAARQSEATRAWRLPYEGLWAAWCCSPEDGLEKPIERARELHQALDRQNRQTRRAPSGWETVIAAVERLGLEGRRQPMEDRC
jgi:hypothetical protein